MYRHPPSHLVAHRGSRGLPTISSAIAVLAIAGLALGACTVPAAGGAISRPDSGATTFPQSNDSYESLRKEHQRTAPATIQAAPVVTSDDSYESLRSEHQRTAPANAS